MRAANLERLLPKPGYCIMCNLKKKPLTREHIFAAWIGRLGLGTQTNTHSYFNYAGEETRQVIPGKHADKKLPILCRDCNNVWGSGLQDDASGLLKPLIRGEWPSLSTADQLTIAKWATCYHYVREFLHPELVTSTRGERLRFYLTTTPPPGIRVWIGLCEDYVDNLPHRHSPLLWRPPGTRPNTALHAFIAGSVMFFIFDTTEPLLMPGASQYTRAITHFLQAQHMVLLWPLGIDYPDTPPQRMTNKQIATIIPTVQQLLNNPLPWLPGAEGLLAPSELRKVWDTSIIP